MTMITAYHRTSAATADAILADGFRDGEGTYMTNQKFRGVWLSADAPLTEQEGAFGDVILAIDLPASLFAEFEWVEDGKTYREALIPADRINTYGPPRIVDNLT